MQRGKIEGESMIIERLLAKRIGALPEEVSHHLILATTDQLENQAMRVQDPPTLEAVFGEH